MVASPSFSISSLMAIVACVAVDIAFIRANWDDPGPLVEVGLAILPMANVLLLALPKIRTGGAIRPGRLGFEVAGWVLIVAVGVSVWSDPSRFLSPLSSVVRLTRGMDEGVARTLVISYGMIRCLAPQVVLALVGGWVFSRCKP